MTMIAAHQHACVCVWFMYVYVHLGFILEPCLNRNDNDNCARANDVFGISVSFGGAFLSPNDFDSCSSTCLCMCMVYVCVCPVEVRFGTMFEPK